MLLYHHVLKPLDCNNNIACRHDFKDKMKLDHRVILKIFVPLNDLLILFHLKTCLNYLLAANQQIWMFEVCNLFVGFLNLY